MTQSSLPESVSDKQAKLKCEYHAGIHCNEPVVAKIGLPSSKAVWTCRRGFNEWRESR